MDPENANTDLQKRYDQLLTANAELQMNHDRRIKTVIELNEKLAQENTLFKDQIAAQNEQIAAQNKQIAAQNKQIAAQNKQIASLNARLKSFEARVEALEDQLARVRERSRVVRSERAAADSESKGLLFQILSQVVFLIATIITLSQISKLEDTIAVVSLFTAGSVIFGKTLPNVYGSFGKRNALDEEIGRLNRSQEDITKGATGVDKGKGAMVPLQEYHESSRSGDLQQFAIDIGSTSSRPGPR